MARTFHQTMNVESSSKQSSFMIEKPIWWERFRKREDSDTTARVALLCRAQELACIHHQCNSRSGVQPLHASLCSTLKLQRHL